MRIYIFIFVKGINMIKREQEDKKIDNWLT